MIDGGWDFIAPAYAVTVLVIAGLAARALWTLHNAARKARDEEKKKQP